MFSNFTAAKNGGYVQLKWQVQNEQKDIDYVIENSTDGVQYSPVGSQQSDSSSDGIAANYQSLYNISPTDKGTLYFRIKRTGANGKSIYSAVKTVSLSSSGIAGFHAYPNPVKSYTMIEFDEVLSGDFIISLINTTGQICLLYTSDAADE